MSLDSMRVRAALVGVLVLLVIVAWFFLLWQPRQTQVADLRDQQEQQRQERAMLEQRLQRLQQLRDEEPRLLAELARIDDALPQDPRLPDFILQVQQAATLAGIEFLSISPSLPSPYSPPEGPDATQPAPETLQAISVSIGATGRYFALEDFIVRMERLPRAVRINSFSLTPGAEEVPPGASPVLSVTFSMEMFLDSAPPRTAGAPVPPPDQEQPDQEDTDGQEPGDGQPGVPEATPEPADPAPAEPAPVEPEAGTQAAPTPDRAGA